MTIIGQNCLKLVKIGLYKAKISQNRPKSAKIGPKSDQNQSKIAFLKSLLRPDHFGMHINALCCKNRKTGFIRRTIGSRAKITPFLNFGSLTGSYIWKSVKKLLKTGNCDKKIVFCHSFLSQFFVTVFCHSFSSQL